MNRIADPAPPQSCPAWRATRALSVLAAIAVVAPMPARAQIAVSPACKLESGPTHAVAQVLDGETVRLDDGTEARLVGALAPRGIDGGTPDADWPPAVAARQALADWVQGRSVALAFGGRRTDRYGRWLAHLLVTRDGREHWVQGEMLEHGMARAYALPENRACLPDLLARERIARADGRGLWANAAYRVRSADQPRDLLAYRHTFQLVAGRIASAARHHSQIQIRLESRKGRGVTIVVHRSGGTDLPAALRPPWGRSVLARGWIEQRGGPRIVIDRMDELELMDAPDPTPGTRTSGLPQ